jgi:hypothetical protein
MLKPGISYKTDHLNLIINEMVSNFKDSFNLLPNQEIIKILSFVRISDSFKMQAVTRTNVITTDNINTYTVNEFDIPMNRDIDIDKIGNNIHLFQSTGEAKVMGNYYCNQFLKIKFDEDHNP